MKSGVHPVYSMTQVTCACGNTFMTRSTQTAVKVEICGACHPFYTGVQKLLDSAGRVERFQKRFAKTEGKMVEREKKVATGARFKVIAKDRKVLTTAPTKKAEKPAAKKPAKKA